MTERDTIARAAAALDDPDVRREAPAPRAVDPLREALEPLFSVAMVEAVKAMRKFPQPNYVISKVAEEAGEVVKAAIHCAEGRETPENVVGEIRQAMAMLIRLYVEGDQVHGLSPLAPCAALAAAPQPAPVGPLREALLDDDSLSAQIGDLGNQIHNLGCTYQNEEDLSERLEELRSTAWKLARRADALLAAGLRLPGAVQPDETPAWAVVGKDGEISLVYLGEDRREIAELIAEVEGKVAVRVAIRRVEDEA